MQTDRRTDGWTTGHAPPKNDSDETEHRPPRRLTLLNDPARLPSDCLGACLGSRLPSDWRRREETWPRRQGHRRHGVQLEEEERKGGQRHAVLHTKSGMLRHCAAPRRGTNSIWRQLPVWLSATRLAAEHRAPSSAAFEHVRDVCTSSQALTRLQLKLPEFRRLCILKASPHGLPRALSFS